MNNKGYSHLLLILTVTATIALLMFLTTLQNKNIQNNKDINFEYKAPTPTPTTSKITLDTGVEDEWEDYNINVTSYPNSLSTSEKLKLTWQFEENILQYGNTASFCLVAFDENRKIITPVTKNDDICFYRYGGEHYGMLIAKGKIDATEANLDLPQNISTLFENTPMFYTAQIILEDQRPQDEVTEWAGIVGYAKTGKVYITD